MAEKPKYVRGDILRIINNDDLEEEYIGTLIFVIDVGNIIYYAASYMPAVSVYDSHDLISIRHTDKNYELVCNITYINNILTRNLLLEIAKNGTVDLIEQDISKKDLENITHI